MGQVNLYTVFHGNLQFSSIKRSDFKSVIDECYWPLLNIVEQTKGLKIGIEFSGETLLEINKLDTRLIYKIKELAKKEKLEFIGSGFTQAIFPLIPYGVNVKNVEFGRDVYQKILGISPEIYFVNEQAISDGIIDVYKNSGINSIISDFDSSPEEIRSDINNLYSLAHVRSQSKCKLKVLWSSSIAFQKFQRLIFDEISEDDYFDYIKIHANSKDRHFPLYCGDWEVFGFSPKKIKRDYSFDFKKMATLFNKLIKGNFRFVLPREVLDNSKTKKIFQLTDSENPIYSKKQIKYNLSRWALAGPSTIWRNTSCYQLYEKILSIRAISKILNTRKEMADLEKKLVSLWGSDFRTFTTSDKSLAFDKRLKDALSKADLRLAELLKHFKKRQAVINLSPQKVNKKVITIPLKGKFWNDYEVLVNGKKVLSQVEPTAFDSKGQAVSAQIVFVVSLSPYEVADFQLVPRKRQSFNLIRDNNEIAETNYVRLHLDGRKGATIKGLLFKKSALYDLMGLTPHGFYHDPALSADWFSGHCLLESSQDKKYSDLAKVDIFKVNGNFPIRTLLFAAVNTDAARILKTYYLYKNESRIDLKYLFGFKNVSLKSARIGNVTVKPQAFIQKNLEYMTVNGGYGPEKYNIYNKFIDQDQMVSLRISSKGCLGSTDGWLAIGDMQKTLGVVWNKAEIAACPIIHFEKTSQGLYGRIQISIGESDETGYSKFEGEKSFTLSYISASNLNEAKTYSKNINTKVLVIE